LRELEAIRRRVEIGPPLWRRPGVVVPLGLALFAALLAGTWWWVRAWRVEQARGALPEIARAPAECGSPDQSTDAPWDEMSRRNVQACADRRVRPETPERALRPLNDPRVIGLARDVSGADRWLTRGATAIGTDYTEAQAHNSWVR
jgi:hypothetical protein